MTGNIILGSPGWTSTTTTSTWGPIGYSGISTTGSLNTAIGTNSLWTTKYIPSIAIAEFMKIEDKDLQKYVFIKAGVQREVSISVKNNEEKYAIYKIEKSIKLNNQGTFYQHNKLVQWLTYDKATKKVKISNANNDVFNHLIDSHFKNRDINQFIMRPTPTLCKKIIEGKINTINDVMEYHRSYTIRNSKIPIDILYKCIIYDVYKLLHLIEDPENLENFEELQGISNINGLIAGKLFKFKVSDIPNIQEIYARWDSEQSKKYDSLKRSGNEKDGYKFSKEPF